jgi:formamidopyrimidine-DNA glycosylase
VPELPVVTVYVDLLQKRIVGRRFVRAIVKSPFLLRSAEPSLGATFEKTVREILRAERGSLSASRRISGWCCI